MLKGPKGSMVVSIIKLSQDSENVSLAKMGYSMCFVH